MENILYILVYLLCIVGFGYGWTWVTYPSSMGFRSWRYNRFIGILIVILSVLIGSLSATFLYMN